MNTLQLAMDLSGVLTKRRARAWWRRLLAAGCVATAGLMLCVSVAPAAQNAESTPDKRLRNAAVSFREVMHEPDKGIPRDLFDKSRCIVIIPGVLKGAFIVGGKYGRGFVSCRRGGTGRFGSPAAIRIEGGSYGLRVHADHERGRHA